eukprot:gene4065-8081_t
MFYILFSLLLLQKSLTFHLPSFISTSSNHLQTKYSRTSSLLSGTQSDVDINSESTSSKNTLTQKEYYIALRNRLFAIDEEIWLYNNLNARPGSKIENISKEKYQDLLRAKGELLAEYPLTFLERDLKDAQENNMTYAAMYIEKMIANFKRQIPIPMNHVNQIAVLSFSGQVVNLMRGQGSMHHRLLPSNIITSRGVKRQFQHPTFSNNGKYIALAELHFRETGGVLRSDALVYEVPTDPAEYGGTDSSPVFDSGDLSGSPFFMRFSPDDQSLAMLCTSPTPPPADGSSSSNNGKNNVSTSLVLMEWGKFHRKDTLGGRAVTPRFVTRKALTLLQGSPLFFDYTTSSEKNATIIAHCQKDTERAVWMLDRQDTGGVRDAVWTKISESEPTERWTTPACHSAGGGDSVLVIEDGWVVTKSLSRWKRGADMLPSSKRLLRLQGGQVQLKVSPDHSRAVILEEDITAGHNRLTAIEGEGALDPCSPDMGNIYEIPLEDKLTSAFWISPDSTKVLCLTIAGLTKDDLVSKRVTGKVALNADMQWMVYNFPLQESKEYDTFKSTPYFMKTYVPFFSQYAQVFNPWAPDSRSFIYVSPTGLCHVPLVGSKHCLGEDKWVNQGSTFGAWSRM